VRCISAKSLQLVHCSQKGRILIFSGILAGFFVYHFSLGPPFDHFDTRRACVKQEISVLENLKKTDWDRDRKHLCSWSNFGIEYQKFRSKNIRLE